jgi:hypothetical protein
MRIRMRLLARVAGVFDVTFPTGARRSSRWRRSDPTTRSACAGSATTPLGAGL